MDAARAAAEQLAEARGQAWRVRTSPAAVAGSFAAYEQLRVDGRAPNAWAPLSGFVRAADGWVRLHAQYPHHAAAITRAVGATDRAELERALAAYRVVEVEQAVTAAGGIAVAVRSAEQWRAHPHGRATAAEPWATVAVTGQRPALAPLPAAGPDRGPSVSGVPLPLQGVRVLDLTRVIAGPTCSQLLACLGADVLRVDPPGRPELLDHHLSTGMGKRSTALDLHRDRDVVDRLVGQADAVLLGYRPGALARFGVDPDELTRRFPRLIVGSLSAWGEGGPWGGRRGFDSIVQAACGIAVVCVDPSASDGRPGALPVQALDHATGQLLAAHVMRLLAAGQSGIVRISLLGAARTLLGFDPPPAQGVLPLAGVRVELDSPHGHLALVPPPLTLDGTTIERPVTGYAASGAHWVQGRPSTGSDGVRGV